MPQTRQLSPFQVRSGHASTSNMGIVHQREGVVKGEIRISHGHNVILQKYEVHRFSKQIRVIGADFPQPLQGSFLWNWKLFQCG